MITITDEMTVQDFIEILASKMRRSTHDLKLHEQNALKQEVLWQVNRILCQMDTLCSLSLRQLTRFSYRLCFESGNNIIEVPLNMQLLTDENETVRFSQFILQHASDRTRRMVDVMKEGNTLPKQAARLMEIAKIFHMSSAITADDMLREAKEYNKLAEEALAIVSGMPGSAADKPLGELAKYDDGEGGGDA